MSKAAFWWTLTVLLLVSLPFYVLLYAWLLHNGPDWMLPVQTESGFVIRNSLRDFLAACGFSHAALCIGCMFKSINESIEV